MKKYRKLAVVLVLAVIAVAVPGCKENEAENPLTYTLSQDGSYYEAKANRADNLETQSITVPTTYEGKPVALARQAFYGLPKLQTVTVEGIVGTVPNQAFANCPMLETVILKGDATVDSRCFADCNSLKSITFGDGIYAIEAECVAFCPELQTVIIGNDCKTIGTKAFQDCEKLESVTLGTALESIDAYAFANTKALKSIVFPQEKPLVLREFAFSYSGLEEIHLPANVVMEQYVFNHLAWDEQGGYSRCKAVYFYAIEPAVENLGINAIGYTWDRTAEDDPELGDFMVYVPEQVENVYVELMETECDESWARCVLNEDKLATFVPEEK